MVSLDFGPRFGSLGFWALDFGPWSLAYVRKVGSAGDESAKQPDSRNPRVLTVSALSLVDGLFWLLPNP